MRKIIVFLIVSVSVFLLYREYSFTVYIPLVFENDEIIEKPSLLSENHKSKMIQVLNYHDEKWKLEDEKLLVKEILTENYYGIIPQKQMIQFG